MDRKEIMARFATLTRNVLRHRNGTSYDLALSGGINPQHPRTSEADADLEAALAKLQGAGWSVLSGRGAPLTKPAPEPENLSAAEYHERLTTMMASLEEAGIRDGDRFLETPAGWLSIAEEVCNGLVQLLELEPGGSVRILQVKEKFGTFRIYADVRGSQQFKKDVLDITGWADAASARRCILTGKPGDVANEPWIVPLSPEARALRTADREEFLRRMQPALMALATTGPETL